MHRFPSDSEKRHQWLLALNLKSEDVKSHHVVCSRHFRNGDPTNVPSLHLGKKFRSPKKMYTSRGIRAAKRLKLSVTPPAPSQTPSPTSSVVSTPAISTPVSTDDNIIPEGTPLTTSESEMLLSDFSCHDLSSDQPGPSVKPDVPTEQSTIIVHTALLARIEFLEGEVAHYQSCLAKKEKEQRYFRIESIANNDSLIAFYTGFSSYEVFLCFFEFLGPSVHSLNYWGDKASAKPKGRRKKKLDSINQLFLTLIKLRLNLKERDLALRFGISMATVSRYFITWVCFLYCHLKEVNWMPDTIQVQSMLPLAFQEDYKNTFSIIDATEVFIETPTDLQLQSSTWSNYKHHNTGKVLVSCTPNGAVNFVSDLYMGSISDVELTRVCGFIEKLDGKQNISVMADRGFTVKDQLDAINVGLNIPPFMEGRDRLPSEEVQRGRKISALRIHVERVIGRIKNYSILKDTLPLSTSRIVSQIVCVCAWLVNFQKVLIPPYTESEEDTDSYLLNQFSSETDYDADTEFSDHEN